MSSCYHFHGIRCPNFHLLDLLLRSLPCFHPISSADLLTPPSDELLSSPLCESFLVPRERKIDTQVSPSATQLIQKLIYHLSHFPFSADDKSVSLANGSPMFAISSSGRRSTVFVVMFVLNMPIEASHRW
jgi:hypothetical protein